MTAQAQLDLLEWVDAGEAVLRNVGQFGPAYDHAKVERFQKATNAIEGVSSSGGVIVSRIRVDGLWGPEVVRALQILLALPAGYPLPSVYPNVYRYQQWGTASTQAYITTSLANLRAAIPGLFPEPAAAPDPRVAAASEAQAAVAAAHEPLTAPPAPEAPPVQPPPDEAAPGPRPPSPRAPLPPPPGGLARRAPVKSKSDIPWLGIGLGVTAAAALLWFLASKRKAK